MHESDLLNKIRCSTLLSVGALALLLAMGSRDGSAQQAPDARMKGSYSFEKGGWTYVHLEGTPEEIGYQHGYLLASQIEDTYQVLKLEFTHMTKRDWSFFRETSKNMLWPHIDTEYQEELTGIAEGAKAHGVDLDVYDIVAMNASMEIGEYYVP